jgi:hypothetical protein
MERHLNLVKSDFVADEKRKLPRFPFCYLVFKSKSNRVFEIKDISFSGMQIALKSGEHNYKVGDTLGGDIHWANSQVNILGKVVWANSLNLGVEFPKTTKVLDSLDQLLSIQNIVTNLKPLHREEFGLELPANLKYWLRADGPIELFIWKHADGELSRFQLILMENFVEWQDGKGVCSGRTKSKRSLETPLLSEDEFIFEFDQQIDINKIQFARSVITNIAEDLLPKSVINFLSLKLGN